MLFISPLSALPLAHAGSSLSKYGSLSSRDTKLVGYVDDPDGRGTASLVISCLLTLVLCVWSAVHLNVPGPSCSTSRWVWLNIGWVFAGIYSPELVVFAAWRQWASARLLQQRIEEEVPWAKHGDERGRGKWTIGHSFFACSGGFAFELDSLDGAMNVSSSEDEINRVKRLTLTAKGMLLLARAGALPWIEKEEIEDKSKANDLAKAMVLIQAAWMLVQVVGRLVARLPVTLLEVNTVAHVLCAFAMYLCWWNKPLLPNESIIIRDEKLAPLAAFMYSSSEISGYFDPAQVKSKTVIKTLFARLSLYSKTPEFETICLRQIRENELKHLGKDECVNIRTADDEPMDLCMSIQRAPQSCLAQLQAERDKDEGTAFFERKPRVTHTRALEELPTHSELKRWRLIQKALEMYGPLLSQEFISSPHETYDLNKHTDDNDNSQGSKNHIAGGTPCLHFHADQLVADHATNWPSNDLLRNVEGLVVGMVLWLANFAYGGFHAAAWNDHFPSTTEQWLWRASACYIGFCGGLWVVLNLAVSKFEGLNKFWEKWMDGEKSLFASLALGVVVFVCGFSLVLARLYLVIEAFVSIRELPVEAYDTPQWIDLFPHF